MGTGKRTIFAAAILAGAAASALALRAVPSTAAPDAAPTNPAAATTTAPAPAAPGAVARPKMPVKECAASCNVDLKMDQAQRKALGAAKTTDGNICLMSCFSRLLPEGDPRKAVLGRIAEQTYQHAKEQNLDVRPPQH